MKTHRLLWLAIAVVSSTGQARDVVLHRKLAEALKLDTAKDLDPDIALYLGEQPVPDGVTNGDLVTQQKERISDADELACGSAPAWPDSETQQDGGATTKLPSLQR